jgi:glutathione S-transferase
MAEGADLVIYGMRGSPFVRKVQVLLAEKGVDFDVRGVNIFPAPEWFAEINPAKRIPVPRDRSIGDAFSIADIAVATQFVNLRLAGGSVDTARWPKLAAYALRIQARPSFAACIEDESRLFPPDSYEL